MTQENIDAIDRGLEDEYAAAFNGRDAQALIALFTEDVTILTEWGDVVSGSAAFGQNLERAFAVVPSDLKIENTPSRTEAITGDVIVSHGMSRKFSREGEEQLVYTRVLVRRGTAWRLAANHVAQPSTLPDPRATNR